MRNGPRPRPALVERNSNSLICEICEENIMVPFNLVIGCLEALGGRTERQKDLIDEIMRECDCGARTAREAIVRAVDSGYIHEVINGPGKSKNYMLK